MSEVASHEFETPQGRARVHLHPAEAPRRGVMVLGHGAGGGRAAPDLVAVTRRACAEGWDVALTEQPYRVAGRRSPPPPSRLDPAWIAIVAHVVADGRRDLPLVTGGRSSGARVACRTAADTGSDAVLCLAFPLQPAARAGAAPRPSRLSELDAVAVPVLVVQGERDAFGMPPEGPGRTVARVTGDHALKADTTAVAGAAGEWLAGVRRLGQTPAAP